MHDTAEQLEVAEAIQHRSAEESPNPTTTTRLHTLGDEVTAQAQAIDRRADLLTQQGVASVVRSSRARAEPLICRRTGHGRVTTGRGATAVMRPPQPCGGTDRHLPAPAEF